MSSKSTLTRSKSLESLHVGSYEVKCRRFCDYYHDNHSQSESSLDVCVIVENRSDVSSTEDKLVTGDMSRASDEGLSVLERKITKLTDILSEQHDLLRSLKDELTTSKNVLRTFTACETPDWLRETAQTLEDLKELLSGSFDRDIQANGEENLLDATQRSQVQRTDQEIRDILNKFLQSDDLKDRIATATAESVKEVICSTFSETFPAAYLPVLEKSHRRLLRHVTRTLENAFNELEAGSEGLFKSVHRTSRSLRIALEKHQALLDANKTESIFDNFEDSLELILKNEFKEWREKLVTLLFPVPQIENNSNFQNGDSYLQINNSSYSASSPPQPADPERSIIDQLMKSAEISKRIKEGDINESFEEALSSSDLSLVVAACKAADPAQIFTPRCSLKQSVLLSLIQQLATDMVHDTQLKCRYLEEAIINLNPTDQATRTHLPLVVGEVQKHLSKFIQLYPCHVANRRINLIIMAATNLLK